METTEADSKEARRTAMGDALGDLCFQLWQQLTWLHIKWREFKELFGMTEATVTLMNATAPNFFGHLEQLILQDLMLHLTRLTDRPKIGIRATLSLTRLPLLIETPALKAEVGELVARAAAATLFARDWRNRLWAHNDLDYAVNPKANPLHSATRNRFEEALAAVRRPVNTVEAHFRVPLTAYERSVPSLKGAGAMLRYLRAGLRAVEQQHS